MQDWNLFYSAITAFSAIMAAAGGLLAFLTRLIIRGALADFRLELLESLDGRYLKNEIANALFKRLDEKQVDCTASIDDLYRLLECRRIKA
jgi:hypothetical protein